MKCPKCHYLGFDTGERCRHCGYDFSLIATTPADGVEPELALNDPAESAIGIDLPLNSASAAADVNEGDAFDLSLLQDAGGAAAANAIPPAPAAVRPAAVASIRAVPEPADRSADRPASLRAVTAPKVHDRSLPLFSPSPDDEDDTPLVKLPAAPRPPLSVRRTPDTPRLRSVPKAAPAPRDVEPALRFTEESVEPAAAQVALSSPGEARPQSGRGTPDVAPTEGSGVRRGVAALLDHAILLSIDAIVAYFTLRMAGLDVDQWALLPRAPLIAFLLLIKIAYFGAFTAMGGQTIGKMAMRIRVVSDAYRELGAAQSVRRTLAGTLSAATLGIGFLPALAGEHRALHDRLARTRVVNVAV